MRKITVLKVEPKKKPYTVDIEGNDSWEMFCNMRNEIDADLGQILTWNYSNDRSVLLFIDEEGKLKDKEYCRSLGLDYIAGTFLVVAYNESLDDYESLKNLELEEHTKYWSL